MARLTQRLGLTRYEADEHYKLALAAFSKGNFDEAILNLDEAIRLLPNNSEYYATRGLVRVEDGHIDDAVPDFEQALKHYAYEMLAHYGLGMVAFRREQWDIAQQHFTAAYRADPKRAETQYYLALVHHRKGEQAIALRVMQQAHQLFNESGDKRKSDAQKWIRTLEKIVG